MRKLRIARTLAIVGATLGVAPQAAQADQVEVYCGNCPYRSAETYYSPYHGSNNGSQWPPWGDNKYIRQSYVHYLGSGTRHLRAGMWVQIDDSYRFAAGTNEVVWYSSIGFAGKAYSKQDPNFQYYSFVTVNASDSLLQR